MEKIVCTSCQKPKAQYQCGVCQTDICKACTQFTAEHQITYLPQEEKDLFPTVCCNPCLDSKIIPELAAYDELVKRAKNMIVYEKDQGKETRLFKRLAEPFTVVDCPDYKEALLRMAFLAAKGNYNAIIDVDIQSSKKGGGSYQKLTWNGSCIPTTLHEKQIPKNKSFWHNPN